MIASGLRFRRRDEVGALRQFAAAVIAVALAFAVCALLFEIAGADVGVAFRALFGGAFGSGKAILETLVKATPLILTGLAAAIAFRAKIWNIGAEGQLYAGAMAAYWATTFIHGLGPAPMIAVVMVFGAAGGAAYAGIAAALKVRFGVNELISTVLLNYIVLYLLSYLLLAGPWTEPGSFYQQTPKIAAEAWLPVLVAKSRLHLGFVVALLAALFVWLLLQKTPQGYEIRAFGFNPTAVRFKGTDIGRMVIVVMCISGALAGLGGVGEVFGIFHRLRPDVAIGLGYTGIIIAMLGSLNPFGCVVAAILFGGLVNGGVKMQILTGVPSTLIFAIEAIVLLFFLTAAAFARYRIAWVREDE